MNTLFNLNARWVATLKDRSGLGSSGLIEDRAAPQDRVPSQSEPLEERILRTASAVAFQGSACGRTDQQRSTTNCFSDRRMSVCALGLGVQMNYRRRPYSLRTGYSPAHVTFPGFRRACIRTASLFATDLLHFEGYCSIPRF